MNLFYKIYCRVFQIGLRIALPILPYRNPEIIDRISDIPQLVKKANLKKPLIITDGNLSKLGAADGLKECLEKEGIAYAFYDGAYPNPTTELAGRLMDSIKPTGAIQLSLWEAAHLWICQRRWGFWLPSLRQSFAGWQESSRSESAYQRS